MSTWAIQYYRSRLQPQYQQVYDVLVHEWKALRSNVTLPNGFVDMEALKEITEAILKDHPELFWVNYYHYQVMTSIFQTALRMDFLFDIQEISRFQSETESWKRRIAAKVPLRYSEEDRIWLLFDYLARQVTYGKKGTRYGHTIVGPMLKHDHVSVCEGIAKSFKFLCDEARIGCIVVVGDADFGPGQCGPHAWNIVKCESGFRHIDVTCQLQLAQFHGMATRMNYLFRDSEMHRYRWNRYLTPSCR